MAYPVSADSIDEHLAAAGHTRHRTRQHGPYNVRVTHDGDDPRKRLDAYEQVLRSLGYTTALERATRLRPIRLRVTHP